MIKLNIGGYSICITFGFLFTVSILILTDSPSVKFTAVTACVIHELGHCFTAIILDVKFKYLKLWAGGINIQLKNELISYKKELAVLISGPLLNMIFSVMYALCKMNGAAEINLILALFNLLPYSSLDGGCILKCLFDYNEKNGQLIQKTAAITAGIIIILVCFIDFPKNILTQTAIILLIADEST